MHSRFWRYLSAVLVTLTLAFAPANVARADVLACFKALAPLEQAMKAAEVAAKAAACGSLGSGDPVMAMTIAAMTAAAAGGLFSNIKECKALINGAVGKLIAEALLTLPLSDGIKKQLQSFLEGASKESFTELISKIPGLEALTAYIQCGCAVAGAPGEAAELAKQYAALAKSCVNFLADAKKWISGTIESGLDAIGNGLESVFGGTTPGTRTAETCGPDKLPDEIWTEKPIYPADKGGCYVIECAKGHVVVEKFIDGKKYNKCSANCPQPAAKFDEKRLCYSQGIVSAPEGICKTTGSTQKCCLTGQKISESFVEQISQSPGQKIDPMQVPCSRACSEELYWNTQSEKCESCGPGWYPVFHSPNSSVGNCAECPAGQTYNFSAKKCEPLDCAPYGYLTPTQSHQCTFCPLGQIYQPSKRACECAEGTFPKAGSAWGCECPKGAIKLDLSATLFRCACPEGSKLNARTLSCECPAGQRIQTNTVRGSTYTYCAPEVRCGPYAIRAADGKCQPCGKGSVAYAGKCVPTSDLRETVLRTLVTPIAPRQPDVACPRGQQLVSGLCVRVPTQPPAKQAKQRVTRCPPGMVPNARGTACIRGVPADVSPQFVPPPVFGPGIGPPGPFIGPRAPGPGGPGPLRGPAR